MNVVLASDRREIVKVIKHLTDKRIRIPYIVSNELTNKDLEDCNLRILKGFEQNTDCSESILISYYYGKLIHPADFKAFFLSVNFHPAPLPYYKGVKCGVHAIVNGEKKFGVTCHILDEKFDEGKILGLSEFTLDQNETGYSISNKSKDALFQLFTRFISKYFLGENISLFDEIPEIKYVGDSPRYYSNNDFEKLKCLTGRDLYGESTARILKALWHPDFSDAYYVNSSNQKIYLKMGV